MYLAYSALRVNIIYLFVRISQLESSCDRSGSREGVYLRIRPVYSWFEFLSRQESRLSILGDQGWRDLDSHVATPKLSVKVWNGWHVEEKGNGIWETKARGSRGNGIKSKSRFPSLSWKRSSGSFAARSNRERGNLHPSFKSFARVEIERNCDGRTSAASITRRWCSTRVVRQLSTRNNLLVREVGR